MELALRYLEARALTEVISHSGGDSTVISLVGKADFSSSRHHRYLVPAHLLSSPCPEPFILILRLCQHKGLSGEPDWRKKIYIS